ncbi:hypothetical protein UFOVP1138_53 [uncultured Caudovirales phage]|uniref:Uncharacterized protein n=1 Tax=uncultured Caudovirales phage TaxID=2100421 RepID=A0A6J5PYS6_9CAUD|nr:hypothetical protein UFOVP975_67 [uncultured Caudovirales phage]CAB4186275.1 hypothetical protein UFOVP1138_53 [uncultured Caudovirales phage]CAB4204430.1 hypothetical protein UFOVP1394_50 [uncultured Caudovirales phage]
MNDGRECDDCTHDCNPIYCELICEGLEGVDLHRFANIDYCWSMAYCFDLIFNEEEKDR